MNWIERLVFWTLLLAVGISICTITGCQMPLRTGYVQEKVLAKL